MKLFEDCSALRKVEELSFSDAFSINFEDFRTFCKAGGSYGLAPRSAVNQARGKQWHSLLCFNFIKSFEIIWFQCSAVCGLALLRFCYCIFFLSPFYFRISFTVAVLLSQFVLLLSRFAMLSFSLLPFCSCISLAAAVLLSQNIFEDFSALRRVEELSSSEAFL